MAAEPSLPLRGRQIVVTRAEAQAGELIEALERLGAEVVRFATIRIGSPADPDALRAAAAAAQGFDWIVFTSTNAVDRFQDALRALGSSLGALRGVRVCAVGPSTADQLRAQGVTPALVPAKARATGVVEALADRGDLDGARILLPRAEVAAPELPERLRRLGADVVEVAAYRTVGDARGADGLRDLLRRDAIDALTFTSGSTVKYFVASVGREIGRARVVSIGPVTTAAAREAGLPVHAEARQPTVASLVNAVRGVFDAPGDPPFVTS